MTQQKDNRETEYRRHTGTTSTPSRRRKNKRLRKLPFIILIFLIILIALIVYIVHQYNSGMKYAKEHAKDVKVHKFNGAVKMMVRFLCLYLVRIKHKGNLVLTQSWSCNMIM